MKKLLFISLCIFTSQTVLGQNLTIDSCIQIAINNYPLLKQNKLIEENGLNIDNTEKKQWMPKLSFIARGSYQSESVEFQGLSFPKDNYLSGINLEQTIFDAGQNKQQRILTKLGSEVELTKNQVEMYKVVDKINQLYCSMMLSKENYRVLQILKNDLENKLTLLRSSVANGLSLESNLETLEAEKLKTEQSIVEASETIKGLYKIMSIYLIFEVNDSTKFSSQIEPIENPKAAFNRPEIRLFETQKMQLEARHKLNQALALPKLTFNADAAYGRPGPNFLDQNLRVFGTAAINLRWNISSLYTLNNEKKQTDLGKKMIDVQREVFDLNTRNALITQESQINALQNILKTDQEILSKRKNISHTASAQFENGTLNSSDYLTQVNAEMQALLNQKIHEIKLMNAILNYNLIKGKNYFNQSN